MPYTHDENLLAQYLEVGSDIVVTKEYKNILYPFLDDVESLRSGIFLLLIKLCNDTWSGLCVILWILLKCCSEVCSDFRAPYFACFISFHGQLFILFPDIIFYQFCSSHVFLQVESKVQVCLPYLVGAETSCCYFFKFCSQLIKIWPHSDVIFR